jgi:hypothetical protein
MSPGEAIPEICPASYLPQAVIKVYSYTPLYCTVLLGVCELK